MEKYKIKNFKIFWKIFEVSVKTFFRKMEGETHPNLSFIFKQLQKCRNEYYSDNF